MPLCATNVDILIVFSNDTGLSSTQKLRVAQRYQLALGAVYGDFLQSGQLDGNETVEVWPLLTDMSVSGASRTAEQLVDWMVDKNANITSTLRIAREALGNPGADLVLMVVPDTADTRSTCGLATEVPRVASKSNSESAAFAIVVLEQNDPECFEEIVVPHEIGHLLYAEHEDDLNGDDLLPSYKNHATVNSSGSTRSLMWSVIDTETGRNSSWLSGYFSWLTSAFADNVDWMSKDSFLVVSQYRAPPPVTNAFNCRVEYSGCANDIEQWLVTYTTNYAMSEVFMERSNNNGITWWPETTGGLVCIPQLVSARSLFRFFGITVSGALTDYCVITVNGGRDCDDYEAW